MTDEMPDTGETEAGADTDWQAEADKWKALARKHEEQAKANSAAAKRLTQMEEANKTEIQKAGEKAAAAEKAAADAETRAQRIEVAHDKGLPKGMAARLTGSTREEMEKDADELLKLLGPQKTAAGRPVADLRSGALSPSDPSKIDADAWIRAQARK